MKVQSILTKKGGNVHTIRPSELIRDAVSRLAAFDIGVLVVVADEDERKTPIGIISERDIVRSAAISEDVFSKQVAQVMTSPVITAILQDDLHSVMHTMVERRIRHMPVVVTGQLIGIISIGDVLKAQRDTYQGEASNLEIQLLADDAYT
jgi:CBS domain-containing protein